MAEMISVLNSSMIGGNLVQIDSKNRYHVTDKNGSKKVLTRDQFQKNIENNADKLQKGEDIKFKKPMSFFSKVMLTLAGACAIAGVIYRKDVVKFFKSSKTKEVLTNIANSESAQTVKHKTREAIKNPKDTLHKIDEAVAKGTEKAIKGLAKIVDFLRGLKK